VCTSIMSLNGRSEVEDVLRFSSFSPRSNFRRLS
jgi:hypothetical protein